MPVTYTDVHCGKCATREYIVSPPNTVCVTTLPCKILITTREGGIAMASGAVQMLKMRMKLDECLAVVYIVYWQQATEETVFVMKDEVKEAAFRLLFVLDFAIMPR